MADRPASSQPWKHLLNRGKDDASPLLKLAAVSKDCVWFNQSNIHEFHKLFEHERGQSVESLQLNENSACLRIELDAKKLNLPIKNDEPDLRKLTALSNGLHDYIAQFILSSPSPVPPEIAREENQDTSQIRTQACGELPDKLVLYIDFNGPHADSDAMHIYQLICEHTDRAQTHASSARPKPLTAAQRIQKIPNGSIEQRVEYITQTCLEIWMTDINYRLKQQFGDDAKLLTLDDLMPKPAAEGVERPPRIEPIQGLHGIVFGEVARCMATRKDLALPPPEVRQLQRLTELKNRTVSPQRETGILLRDFPQIGKLEKNGKPEGLGDPEALYYTLHRDVNYTLADYLNNKHLNNERPSGLGLG